MKQQFSFGLGIGLTCVLVTSIAIAQHSITTAAQSRNLSPLASADANVVGGTGEISSIDVESSNVTIEKSDKSKVDIHVPDMADLQELQTSSSSMLKVGDVVSFVDTAQENKSFFVDELIVSSTNPLRLTGGQDSGQTEETVVRTPFTVDDIKDDKSDGGGLKQDKEENRRQVGTLTIFKSGTADSFSIPRFTIEFSKTTGIQFNRINKVEISNLSVGQRVMFAAQQTPKETAQLIQLKVLPSQ